MNSRKQQQPDENVKAKRKARWLKSLVVTICIACVLAVSAYFFLPGLLRPYDLGIKTSAEAYESAVKKLKLQVRPQDSAAADNKVERGSTQEVEAFLDSEELTSFLNENQAYNKAMKNVQVRINADDTVETSATLDTSYLFDEVLAGKYTREDISKALPMVGLLPDKINFSCRFSGGIKDNRAVDLSIDRASLMGIPIPEAVAGSTRAEEFFGEAINGYLAATALKSGADYELLQVNNGMLELKGKIPSSISKAPVE